MQPQREDEPIAPDGAPSNRSQRRHGGKNPAPATPRGPFPNPTGPNRAAPLITRRTHNLRKTGR